MLQAGVTEKIGQSEGKTEDEFMKVLWQNANCGCDKFGDGAASEGRQVAYTENSLVPRFAIAFTHWSLAAMCNATSSSWPLRAAS